MKIKKHTNKPGPNMKNRKNKRKGLNIKNTFILIQEFQRNYI